METGPAPLVAPPRRHGAPAAPSPPPRGSRAGPVLVVAPGPPVTTATSAPVTLVAPGEARPAWVPGLTQTSDSVPGPTVTASTEVGLTLEASPDAPRAQVSGPEPLVPEAVAGAEMSVPQAPGADPPKTEEAITSPDPGPGTLTRTPDSGCRRAVLLPTPNFISVLPRFCPDLRTSSSDVSLRHLIHASLVLTAHKPPFSAQISLLWETAVRAHFTLWPLLSPLPLPSSRLPQRVFSGSRTHCSATALWLRSPCSFETVLSTALKGPLTGTSNGRVSAPLLGLPCHTGALCW